jgi:hypothetical protein
MACQCVAFSKRLAIGLGLHPSMVAQYTPSLQLVHIGLSNSQYGFYGIMDGNKGRTTRSSPVCCVRHSGTLTTACRLMVISIVTAMWAGRCCVLWTARATFSRRNDQNTPLSDEVTITDPAHPLFGKTLAVVSDVSPRGKSHLIVSLPNGDHRSVPRSVTDWREPFATPPVRRDLPFISVRTILPVACFIRDRLRAMEGKDDELMSGSIGGIMEAEGLDGHEFPGQVSAGAVEPDGSMQSPATGPTDCRADSTRPAPATGNGGQGR